MPDIYDLIFKESNPQEEKKDIYSLIFQESKKPEIEEAEIPLVEEKKSPFLEKIGKIKDFLMPAIMQVPGLREQFRVPERKAAQPPYPEMRALTPKEEEIAAKRIVPEKKTRVRYEEMGGLLNYLLEQQPSRVGMWLTAFAGSPVLIGLFEALQQVKNITLSVKDKARYDPLAQRLLTEMLPEDTPGWLRAYVLTTEIGADMIIAGVASGAIKEGAFRKYVNKIIEAGKKFGWEEFQVSKGGRSLDELREIVFKYAKRGTVEQELKNMMSKVEGKIPSPLTRRVTEPGAFIEPETKMPSRLTPAAKRIATEEGVVFEPGAPEAEVLKEGYRAVEPKTKVNIMPKADGSFDITIPRPEAETKKTNALESLWGIFKTHPRILYKDLEKYPYLKEGDVNPDEVVEYFESKGKEVIGKPKAKVAKEKKPPKFKDPLYQIIQEEGRVKPNEDYSRKELLKILPPRLIASEKDPSAKAMDLMAQAVKREFPFIEGDVDLYDELSTRKRAPVEKAYEEAEREKIEQEYEEFEAERETRPESEWEEGGRSDVFGQPGDDISWLGGRDNPRAIISWDELEDQTVVYRSRLADGSVVMDTTEEKPRPYFNTLEEAQRETEGFLAEQKYVDRWKESQFKKGEEIPPSKRSPRELESEIRAHLENKSPDEIKAFLLDPSVDKAYKPFIKKLLDEKLKGPGEPPTSAPPVTAAPSPPSPETLPEKTAKKPELFRMSPTAKKLERLLRQGKLKGMELKEEEKEFLKERGMYEEEKAPETKPLPEPEIEEAPERIMLTKISIEDPTGKVETFEIPEHMIGGNKGIRQYAINLGVLDKVKIGQPFPGRWKEHYSPAEHEKTIRQFIREVKTVPKEEWELYSGYPFTKEVKEAVKKVQERLKTKRRIKLEELEEELKKTDEGKVEWMYLESERQFKEKRKPSFKKGFKWAKRATVDTSGNVKKQLIKDLGPLGKEAVIQHDLVAGASGKAEKIYEDASKEIYKGLSRDDEALLNRAIQSRRTIAISGYKPEVKHPMGLTAKEHEAFMKTIPEEINKRADRYFKKMEKVLDELKSEGLIDEESYQNLKSKGDYSPRRFIQYIDPERTYTVAGKTITVPDSGLKALDEGSYRVMETNSRLLLSSVISRTQNRIFRNRANKALYQLADEIPDNEIVKKAEVYKTTKKGKPVYQKAPAGHTKLKAMIDGKAKEIIMPDEYAKEWITRDPLVNEQLANIIGWLSGSKILKPMATGLNPGFALTNFPRDIAHVWLVTSEYSSFFPKSFFQIGRDLLSTAKDSWGRKGRWIDYIDEGGSMTFLTHQGKPFKTTIPIIKNIQDVLGYLGETSEIWTRLALRERAIRNGKPPHEATWIARNYLDFNQGGSVMKALDTGVPYLNAGIQATRGIFRAMADRPGQTLWKFAQLGALASGLYLANHYVHKDEYAKVSEREKVNNFIIMTPYKITDKSGNERCLYFKIAKDQGQRIVCSIFENLMKKAIGEEVNATEIAKAAQDFIPVIPSEKTPPSMDAFFGYMANKDFWLWEDVWKGEKVTPREEYTIYTHPALVKAGKATGLSPERLNYALSQFFTRGNIYTSLVGGGLSAVMKDMPKEDKRKTTTEIITRLPLVKRVVGLTPPYSEKEIKQAEKAKVEESTRRFKQRRELNEIANRYYRKLKDEKVRDESILAEARAFIKKQPVEDRKRLGDWFRNYGRVYGLSNKLWWLDLADMPPEARATVFWTKYMESDRQEQKELKIQARKIPSFWSDRFQKRFLILMNKWKRENE